jgi:hypothetical protein
MRRTWHGRQGEHRLGVANCGAHWHGSARQARHREARMGRVSRSGTWNGPDWLGKPWSASAGRDVSGIGRAGEARPEADWMEWLGLPRHVGMWLCTEVLGLDWRIGAGHRQNSVWQAVARPGVAGVALVCMARPRMALAGQSRYWREALRHGPNRHGSDG